MANLPTTFPTPITPLQYTYVSLSLLLYLLQHQLCRDSGDVVAVVAVPRPLAINGAVQLPSPMGIRPISSRVRPLALAAVQQYCVDWRFAACVVVVEARQVLFAISTVIIDVS